MFTARYGLYVYCAVRTYVYCAVRTVCLLRGTDCMFKYDSGQFSYLIRADPSSISGPFMWDLLWTKWHWDRSLSECSAVSIAPTMLNLHRLHVALARTNGRRLGTFQKAIIFRKSRIIGQIVRETSFILFEGIGVAHPIFLSVCQCVNLATQVAAETEWINKDNHSNHKTVSLITNSGSDIRMS